MEVTKSVLRRMEAGDREAVMEGLSSQAALARTVGVIWAARYGMSSPAAEQKLRALLRDDTCLFGYNAGWRVCHFAAAALELLGLERYSGEEQEVLRLIESGFDFRADKSGGPKMTRFGFFKGLPYRDCSEDFSKYLEYKNKLPKQKIMEHIESLPAELTSLPDCDIFTGEKLHGGMCFDHDFIFPLDFIHYYKNYDIGIPYEYEAYLREIL